MPRPLDASPSRPAESQHTAAPLVPGLSRQYLLHHRVCPKAAADEGATLFVAAAPQALRDACVDELRDAYRASIVFEPAEWSDVEAMIERLCAGATGGLHGQEAAGPLLEVEAASHGDGASDASVADVRDLAAQPPVVRYVSLLLRDAQDAGASDIHLEATRSGLTARVRVDGVLAPTAQPPAGLGAAIVSRIKLLAELDIAERRRPQDGRIRVRLERRELDVRVSTVPTAFGESVVLRLLDSGGRPVALEELGMPALLLHRIADIARRPHGLLLVTGPTGSGKTTTLYACLQRRDLVSEKVITVEDPIEYSLPNVTQVPVHRQAGVSFGTALRSILRQDPDVVMIGEMRDAETAEIAVQAAMTGHLVLSTLHTNDAVSAIPRLLDLKVPPYLVASTLEGVLAQRLVRRICDGCRTAYIPPDEVLQEIAGPEMGADAARALPTREFSRGIGCPACRGTGYAGRIGIYELLPMTDDMREAVARGYSRAELRGAAAAGGWRPLRFDGIAKACAGITTVGEVLRVSQG